MRLVALVLVLALSGCAVSTRQEVEMGASYAQQIERELPVISDPELTRYINVLGDSIARIADARNLDWRFSIVDSPDVNAVPGGFIYINRGLIERAETMAQVAGVLGHEIGHVTMRHSIQQMQKAQGANIGITAVCVLTSICNSEASQAAINIGANAAFASFSPPTRTRPTRWRFLTWCRRASTRTASPRCSASCSTSARGSRGHSMPGSGRTRSRRTASRRRRRASAPSQRSRCAG